MNVEVKWFEVIRTNFLFEFITLAGIFTVQMREGEGPPCFWPRSLTPR